MRRLRRLARPARAGCTRPRRCCAPSAGRSGRARGTSTIGRSSAPAPAGTAAGSAPPRCRNGRTRVAQPDPSGLHAEQIGHAAERLARRALLGRRAVERLGDLLEHPQRARLRERPRFVCRCRGAWSPGVLGLRAGERRARAAALQIVVDALPGRERLAHVLAHARDHEIGCVESVAQEIRIGVECRGDASGHGVAVAERALKELMSPRPA